MRGDGGVPAASHGTADQSLVAEYTTVPGPRGPESQQQPAPAAFACSFTGEQQACFAVPTMDRSLKCGISPNRSLWGPRKIGVDGCCRMIWPFAMSDGYTLVLRRVQSKLLRAVEVSL
jgi:hypothetical protein